jgi:hypothetical protein
MLKFDDMNVPEDATRPQEMIFCELMNTNPSEEGLHPTKGTRQKVFVIYKDARGTHLVQAAW